MTNKKPELNDILQELQVDYLTQFPKRLQQLEQLSQQLDIETLAMEYHKLKGTGKTYGFPEISQLCEMLELICDAHLPLDQQPSPYAPLTPPENTEFLLACGLHLLQLIFQARANKQVHDLSQEAQFRSVQQAYFKLTSKPEKKSGD